MTNKDATVIKILPMAEIFSDSTFNCRGVIAPIDVADLAKDIDEHGLQQPPVVKPLTDDDYKRKAEQKYKLVSGHRRHRAFQVLGRTEIPCIVNSKISDTDALILNLGENLHRRDLNILQEARAIERLYKSGLHMSDIATAITRSNTWVRTRIQLLELPEAIQEAAASGFINQRHISDIHGLKDVKKQMEAAKKVKEAKLRGEKVPRINVKNKRNILKPKQRDRDEIFWMQDHIQNSIGNNFGTRCLAWAAGELNDYEIFKDIEEIAIKAETKYTIPYHLGGIPL